MADEISFPPFAPVGAGLRSRAIRNLVTDARAWEKEAQCRFAMRRAKSTWVSAASRRRPTATRLCVRVNPADLARPSLATPIFYFAPRRWRGF